LQLTGRLAGQRGGSGRGPAASGPDGKRSGRASRVHAKLAPVSADALEIAKLLAQVATPVIVAVLGVYFAGVARKFEQRAWQNQKLIEKRLAIYDEIAPLLNDVLCYFTFVGSWKDMKPTEVVALKRLLDKKIHLAAPLLSPEFYKEATEFIDLCFETYTAWGQDAKLRTQPERRREATRQSWDSAWDALFTANCSDPREIRAAYQDVMQVFSRDLCIAEANAITPAGEAPGDIPQ
jgi:hypothetical protein